MKIGPSVVTAGASLLLVLFVFYDNVRPLDRETLPPPTNSSNSNIHGSLPASPLISKPLTTTKCDAPRKEALVQKPIRALQIDLARRDAAVTASFTNPMAALSKAQAGDLPSALALFNMLSSCYPLGLSEEKKSKYRPRLGCPSVAVEVSDKRFEILEPFAKGGDPLAQTVYATNATALVGVRKFAVDQSVVDQNRIYLADAEKYATAAAKEGSKEAISFLAEAYRDGSFGVPNKMRAYSYMLALKNQYPNSVPSSEIALLEKILGSKNVLLAAAQVDLCRPVSLNSQVNPFKQGNP